MYVTGFSPGNTNARDLVDRFDEVGKVERIHMKEKFAFITMKSGASKAVREFDGATFQGKKLRVEFVKVCDQDAFAVELYLVRGGTLSCKACSVP